MRDFCAKTRREPISKDGIVFQRLACATVVLTVLAIGNSQTSTATAAPLGAARFASLAAACAPGVAVDVLRAVAAKESGFDPLALHDNTRKITRMAVDAKAGAVLAQSWIAAGDSVDVGLMQINAPNLPRLGLTVAQALDPCLSLAAGAAVLRDAYRQGATQAEQQAALLIMLSRYNTGRSLAGLVNGYVGDVVVGASPPRRVQTATVPSIPQTPAVPEWDVWANASLAQTHGAAWLVNLSVPASPSTKPADASETSSHKPQ